MASKGGGNGDSKGGGCDDPHHQRPRLRIVSLLPSITEILAALGFSEEIVGVTHCCDYPPSALNGAVVVTTSEVRPALLSQREIHERVCGSHRRGDSLYSLDDDALRQLRPVTHVFTQSLCDVCAVSSPLVQETCARIFAHEQQPSAEGAPPPDIVSLEPKSLSDVWLTVRYAGRLLGAEANAEAVVVSCLHDLEQIREAVREARLSGAGEKKKPPKVAFLEWHDPFFSGGHWVADMVEIAGGDYTLNESGRRSARLTDEELLRYDPDVILIGPCGFDTDRAVRDTLPLLNSDDESRAACWRGLRAVQAGRVYALDGNSYYARPGPRLVQGVGLMARCLHPGIEIPERLAPTRGMRQITLDMYTPAK